MSLNKFRAVFRASCSISHSLFAKQQTIFHQHRTILVTNYTTGLQENVLPNKAELKMKIEFTCKVCQTRNEKYFSKAAYTHGVVIIRCDGCSNNHLIADNLNWFPDFGTNVEEILAKKGIEVKKGVTIEAAEDSDKT